MNEERVWTYLVQVNKVADAKEVALNCDVTEEFAQSCIDRIGTPREVLLGEPSILMEGHKDDGGKARMDLIPPEVMTALGEVLSYGAAKYAPRNWEKGMNWGRPFAALMRHMWAWWRGEANDPETGYSHLWHSLCCIAFLTAYEARNCGVDDRPEPSKEKSK